MPLKTLMEIEQQECEPFGIKVHLRTNVKSLANSLGSLYADFPKENHRNPGDGSLDYSVLETGNGDRGKSPFVILEDKRQVYKTKDEEMLLPYLEWFINGALLKRLDHLYQIHTGMVSKNGTGIILPGPSGSGKTTLVIGLLKKGFRYLSDEISLIDPETLKIYPFPRSILVSKKNAKVLSLSDHEASILIRERKYNIEVRANNGLVGDPVRAKYVVFPTYTRSSSRKPRLTAISKGTALIKILRSSLNFPSYGQKGIDTLIRFLEKTECFTLRMGDLKETVELLSAHLEKH